MSKSPSFIAHFADGEVTRMSVHSADPRKPDYRRGARLAVQAYRSRCRKEPPAIVKASFQRSDETLVEYTAEELGAASFRPLKPKLKPKLAKPKSNPKPKLASRPVLNAIGWPFSPQYDPGYRLKHKPATGRTKRVCGQTGDLFSLDSAIERIREEASR
jgi:hypothetical protein